MLSSRIMKHPSRRNVPRTSYLRAISSIAVLGSITFAMLGCASSVGGTTTPDEDASPGDLPDGVDVPKNPRSPSGDPTDPSDPASPGDGGTGRPGGPTGATPDDGVMMQAFYWNVPTRTNEGSWWKHLSGKLPELRTAGITALWIPPAYKGAAGANDVGYGVYDRYDLGEFQQKGSVATRYGTASELESFVREAHNNDLAVYADIVMNHMVGADDREQFDQNGRRFDVYTRFRFPGRGNKLSSFVFTRDHFNGCDQYGWQQWHPWDFEPRYGGEAWDNLLGCELRLTNAAVQGELITWGKWMTDRLKLDGYRLDAVKHMETRFVNAWLDAVRGQRFAVSEAWFAKLDQLTAYAKELGDRTHLFDVPLHYSFYAMSNGNGAWDMRNLKFAGFTEANGKRSVSFVDNHDTDTDGALSSPVRNLKNLAYAYILLRHQGYPTIFYRDYFDYGMKGELDTLLRIRQENAGGAAREHDESDQDVYVYSRAGDAKRTGLVVLLNDGGNGAERRVKTPFANKTLREVGGHSTATVKTDGNGYATLSVPARNWAVWAPSR